MYLIYPHKPLPALGKRFTVAGVYDGHAVHGQHMHEGGGEKKLARLACSYSFCSFVLQDRGHRPRQGSVVTASPPVKSRVHSRAEWFAPLGASTQLSTGRPPKELGHTAVPRG